MGMYIMNLVSYKRKKKRTYKERNRPWVKFETSCLDSKLAICHRFFPFASILLTTSENFLSWPCGDWIKEKSEVVETRNENTYK